MNSKQLETILKNTKVTKNKFQGIFASNNIPKFKKFPHCFVANTDRAGTVGEHWIDCYVPNPRTIEYFDTFGDKPNFDLSAYLNRYDNVLINDRQIQSPFSDSCGHYCVYFLVARCSGTPYCETMETLYKTRAMSDLLVKDFVRHILRV